MTGFLLMQKLPKEKIFSYYQPVAFNQSEEAQDPALEFQACFQAGDETPEKVDNRYRRLLGKDKWDALPKAVRQRFSKKLGAGESIVYTGTVTDMVMRPLGWLLAQGARIIGAPLPVDPGCKSRASVVAITDDPKTDGQVWTRVYAKPQGFSQTVNSVKRFSGPTGLEEHIGCGIGMALNLSTEKNMLLFKSDHYFLTIFGKRVKLPAFMTPGHLAVGHHDLSTQIRQGAFAFTLTLIHPVFGLLLYQRVVFHDMEEKPRKETCYE